MAQADAVQKLVGEYNAAAKAKLSNPAATGQPEDQLRNPLETLFAGLAAEASVKNVTLVGETSLADLKTRPDFSVTAGKALIGFIEVKAPGKGANPKAFTDPHDKEQWTKLQSLPNLIYTDGNALSLWRNGERVGDILHFEGGIDSAGAKLGETLSSARIRRKGDALPFPEQHERVAVESHRELLAMARILAPRLARARTSPAPSRASVQYSPRVTG